MDLKYTTILKIKQQPFLKYYTYVNFYMSIAYWEGNLLAVWFPILHVRLCLTMFDEF